MAKKVFSFVETTFIDTHASTLTAAEIAKHLGCRVTSVQKYVKEKPQVAEEAPAPVDNPTRPIVMTAADSMAVDRNTQSYRQPQNVFDTKLKGDIHFLKGK